MHEWTENEGRDRGRRGERRNGMFRKKLNQKMFGKSFKMYNIPTCYLLITKARRSHFCPHSPFCFS